LNYTRRAVRDGQRYITVPDPPGPATRV